MNTSNWRYLLTELSVGCNSSIVGTSLLTSPLYQVFITLYGNRSKMTKRRLHNENNNIFSRNSELIFTVYGPDIGDLVKADVEVNFMTFVICADCFSTWVLFIKDVQKAIKINYISLHKQLLNHLLYRL